VRVEHRSSVDSSYSLSGLRFFDSNAAAGNCTVNFVDSGAGKPSFSLGDSDLRFVHLPGGLGSNGVCAYGSSGDWTVGIFRNHLHAENRALLRGIAVTGTTGGNVSIAENVVEGSRYANGILVSKGAGSPANSLDVLSNAVTGQSPVDSGEYAVQLVLTNTTVRANNNTVVDNRSGLVILHSSASDTSSGRVANNLLAFNTEIGLEIDASPGVSNAANLVYANGSNIFVPGPGTITNNPQLTSRGNPRPVRGSVAQDTGSNADVPPFLFGPTLDADGEPRITGGIVDIGAFEVNRDLAAVHVSTAVNSSGDSTVLDAPIWQGLIDHETLQVTPHAAPAASAESGYTLGVFQIASPQPYALFNENQLALSAGRAFSVLAPLDGWTNYVHTATPANSVSEYTQLDHPELNNKPAAVALVTSNWNPSGGGGFYHDHRISLEYFSGHWYVRNEDSVDMAVNHTFNIAIATSTTPNAFHVNVGASTASELKLSQRLLDENPCAAPQVTRADDPYTAAVVHDDIPFVLAYRHDVPAAPGHWYLYAVGSGATAFPAGAGFNIAIPGAQAQSCRDDRIFSNDFET